MKNKISDLNNHLFVQLERLSDEELKGEDLDREVKRADAIVKVSEQLVRSATVSLKAAELSANSSLGRAAVERLPLLESKAVEAKPNGEAK